MAHYKTKLTKCEWVLLHNTDGPKARCRNIDWNKVDGHVLRHVYSHWLLCDWYVDLVDTWRTSVVVVVVVVLVVVVVGKLNLGFKTILEMKSF